MTDDPAKRPRFSLIKLVLLSFVLASAAFVAWNLTPRHDPQIQAIRAQGYPVTYGELNQWYQKPPDAENAALIYTNAFAKISAASNAFDQINNWILPPRGQSIRQDDKEEFNALLATNQEPLTLLDSAAALPKCRYPIDLTVGPNFLLPYLAPVKGAVKILTTRGCLEAAEGHSEAATRSFLSAGHLAGSLSEEPLLISQLVEIASWAVLARQLEWSLNATEFSPHQLEQLQMMFANAENNAFYRGFVGERVLGYSVFGEPKSQLGAMAPNPFGPSPGRGDRIRYALFVDALKATGLFQKDRAFFLSKMSNIIAVAKLPFPERFTASQNLSFVPPRKFYLFSSMMLPALSKGLSRDTSRAATMRVAQTALAIERFRHANPNLLPQDLSQLVPAYSSAVPADPFDGKPLRFKKRDHGYVVYSIGSDLQDDGGAERDPKKTGVTSDITFILER